ncbi:hypothetical protein AB0I22_00825 [Streptomyces sp. NPDC050610]|uniref:hypothetical protein n=1 Tax=Streptomyces sp. NPDC050610 TaxID=3157097 RepID=UPI0034317A32
MRLAPDAPGTYFPGRGTLVEETYLKGKAKGWAQSILRLLEGRGVPVSESVRERITNCTDLDTLNHWFNRAVTATDAEELFAEEEDQPSP